MTSERGALSQTLEFSTEDYNRIMVKDSLFDDGIKDFQTRDGLERNLRRLYDRETRLRLHAMTLSDYLRKGQIPRGLRIQKAPTIGISNERFCEQWSQIMNKCSFDLMVLVIQEVSEQLDKTREEIQAVRAQFNETFPDKDKLSKLESELTQFKLEMENKLKAQKIRKFERDNKDYANSRVYRWKGLPRDTPPDAPARIPRDVRRAAWRYNAPQHSDTSSLDTESEFSDGLYANDDFLGRRGERGGRPPRRGQRGKNVRGESAGGGRERKHRSPYSTRSKRY